MKELINWLKENIGDDIKIITPQFERTDELDYKWKPENEEQFVKFIESAPWKVLKGCGFRKWDTMNNLIKENIPKPVHKEYKIPYINAPGELIIDMGRGQSPTELLEEDEDVILFPGEWYDIIPSGFMVTGLYGEQYPFRHNESDDDIRFGCLPYGIRRKVSPKVEVSK